MVVRSRPSLFVVLFALQGSILPRVAPKILGISLSALAVVAVERVWPEHFQVGPGIAPFTLIGVALSIFLSFRNGACYDRWWEARRAWGTLILETRGLARTLPAVLGPDQEALWRQSLRRVCGFAHALHAGLRGTGLEAEAARPWLPASEAGAVHPSPADAVLAGLGRDLGRAFRAGTISDIVFGMLEQKIAALAQVQIVCERIQSTPLPFAYTLLLYRTAWLYCLLLPFGLAGTLGWATPVATALVAYTFFGLDALGDELEEPFGTEPNDLPLDAMLRQIEATVLDALGEAPPPPLRPKNSVLS